MNNVNQILYNDQPPTKKTLKEGQCREISQKNNLNCNLTTQKSLKHEVANENGHLLNCQELKGGEVAKPSMVFGYYHRSYHIFVLSFEFS